VHDGAAAAAEASKAAIEGGLTLITLQSDAILLAPGRVRALSPWEDLHGLYAEFWRELSSGALELDDFFAHQDFEGGYRYHRYLGSAEKASKPNGYRPYYLTKAGSVFKLKVLDPQAAALQLAGWRARGLPLPAWAQAEYGASAGDRWRKCPFVPENGYGEIAVNLEFHWKQPL
jgi:hypothetical protein